MVDSMACETECGPTRLPVGGGGGVEGRCGNAVAGRDDWLGRCDRGLYGERTGKVLYLSLNTPQSCGLDAEVDLLTATPHGRSARLEASSRMLVVLERRRRAGGVGRIPLQRSNSGSVGEWSSVDGRTLLRHGAWLRRLLNAGCWSRSPEA